MAGARRSTRGEAPAPVRGSYTAPMPLRAFLLAVLVTFIWGVNFVVIRLSVHGAPPLLVAALRFALAALPAVFFLKRPAVPLRLLVGYGLTVGLIQFGLLYVAVALGLSAGLASLLMQIQAFFTALLSAAWLRERLLPNQVAGMALAFLGMALIGASGNHAGGLLIERRAGLSAGRIALRRRKRAAGRLRVGSSMQRLASVLILVATWL